MQKLFEADFFYQYLQHKINLMGKNVSPKYWLVIGTHQLEWGRWAAVWAGQYESQPSFRRWVSCAGTRTTAESPETWKRRGKAKERRGGSWNFTGPGERRRGERGRHGPQRTPTDQTVCLCAQQPLSSLNVTVQTFRSGMFTD